MASALDMCCGHKALRVGVVVCIVFDMLWLIYSSASSCGTLIIPRYFGPTATFSQVLRVWICQWFKEREDLLQLQRKIFSFVAMMT